MQIAKLFAGLGFQVDTSGLVVFKKALADARSEMTNITRGGKNATRQFRNLRREVDKLSSSMGKIKNAGGNRAVGNSYRNLAGDVWKVRNALDSIATNQPRTTKAIGKITASVIAGLTHWNAYRRSIVQTRQSLANLNGDLARLRANARIDVRIRNQGGGGGSGGGNGGNGGAGGLGGLGSGMGAAAFMRNIIPMAGLGVAGAAGFGTKATVEAARDQTRMESTLLMTSKSQAEYANTLKYVREESARLGLSSVELGKSYAQINMSARGLSQDTKKEMFTGFSEFMMSMGTSADDQKGIFRAFNQMFSNNRLLQEEINQLSDRGIPATLVYDAAMKAYDTQSMAKIKKLQEDGKLDPNRVLPVMAEMVQNLAHDSGAYAKMMESSIVKQGQFMNQLSVTSKEIMDSGLDEFLGKIFGQLTKLVVVVGNVAESIKFFVVNIKDASKWIKDTVGGTDLLVLGLFALIFRFKGVSLALQRANIVLIAGGKRTRALAVLIGGLGKAIRANILRLGLWGVAIYGAIKLLDFLGKELKRDRLGGWTIFDDISMAIDIMSIKMNIAVLKTQVAIRNLHKLMTDPWGYFSGNSASGHVRTFFGLDEAIVEPNFQKDFNTPKAGVPVPYAPQDKSSFRRGLKEYSSDPNNRLYDNMQRGVRQRPDTFEGILNLKVNDGKSPYFQSVNLYRNN